jgi:aspartyl/asparaginyl beta-hydroxylase (cupin superfamily)
MTTIARLEQRARETSAQGDMAAAEQACREIQRLDPDHVSSLHFLSQIAQQRGDWAEAVSAMRRLTQLRPGDASLYSQLGQALYGLGQHAEAIEVYLACWRANPRNPLVYLALGCLYAEQGDTERAAQIFSLGESVKPDLLRIWQDAEAVPGYAQMSRTAWQTLCDHHTELHLRAVDALGNPGALARIRNAVWPLLDARPVHYRHEKQRAQVFYIEYPENPRFFERESLPWCDALEAEFPTLRDEILRGLDVEADGRPYLGDGHRLEGEQWASVVNRMNWASVHLYSEGTPNERVIHKFPRTLAALEKIPLATFRDRPKEVFLSVLAPNTRIPEHYGVSSAVLTVHLPIQVPDGCGLMVDGEVREPREGQVLAFDDTWEHAAWNDSDAPRVVLIFELWHPALTALEREAILATFNARAEWLKQRRVD